MISKITSLPWLVSISREWSSLFAFLCKPILSDRINSSFISGLSAITKILVLDVLAMFGLVVIAALGMMAGIEIPRTSLAELALTPTLVLSIILFAPILEESIFRSWLTGQPRYLVLLAVFIIISAFNTMADDFFTLSGPKSILGAVNILGVCLGIVLAATFWKRATPIWYRKKFWISYWLSATIFALVHLFNYTGYSILTLVPFVLPQFVLGALLGYLRCKYGLWASFALHAAHNSIILSIVLLAR